MRRAAIESFEEINEQVRQVDALIQLGCAYRDLMYLYREHPGQTDSGGVGGVLPEKHSMKHEDRQAKNDLQTLDAWVREAWTNYYLASYYRRIARDRNLALAEDAISQVYACLDEGNKLIDAHYPDYRIIFGQGWKSIEPREDRDSCADPACQDRVTERSDGLQPVRKLPQLKYREIALMQITRFVKALNTTRSQWNTTISPAQGSTSVICAGRKTGYTNDLRN